MEKSTTFFPNCGACKKALEPTQKFICGNERCKRIARCAVWYCPDFDRGINGLGSKLPVRGLILWCQQCSHSGHAKCLAAWFQSNRMCPSGCPHQCFRRKVSEGLSSSGEVSVFGLKS